MGLQDVGFEPHGRTSEKSMLKLEQKIGSVLPLQIRSFLLETGGGYLEDALAECTEPTPFGKLNIVEFRGVDEIQSMLRNDYAPGNMVVIGLGHMGLYTGVSVAGPDAGHIYAIDSEFRHDWEPERYSRLKSASIQDFYRLKNSRQLPVRRPDYENCYHVSDTFESFVEKLHL